MGDAYTIRGMCVCYMSILNYTALDQKKNGTKGGDTLSSRHVSSCDVTRAVGMWEAI